MYSVQHCFFAEMMEMVTTLNIKHKVHHIISALLVMNKDSQP